MGVVLPENKSQTFVPSVVFLHGWPFPHRLPLALHLHFITFQRCWTTSSGLGMGQRGEDGCLMQIILASFSKCCQPVPALAGSIFSDPGTLLIVDNSHQLCKNTVTMTTTTTTRVDEHKAQEAFFFFFIGLWGRMVPCKSIDLACSCIFDYGIDDQRHMPV